MGKGVGHDLQWMLCPLVGLVLHAGLRMKLKQLASSVDHIRSVEQGSRYVDTMLTQPVAG